MDEIARSVYHSLCDAAHSLDQQAHFAFDDGDYRVYLALRKASLAVEAKANSFYESGYDQQKAVDFVLAKESLHG